MSNILNLRILNLLEQARQSSWDRFEKEYFPDARKQIEERDAYWEAKRQLDPAHEQALYALERMVNFIKRDNLKMRKNQFNMPYLGREGNPGSGPDQIVDPYASDQYSIRMPFVGIDERRDLVDMISKNEDMKLPDFRDIISNMNSFLMKQLPAENYSINRFPKSYYERMRDRNPLWTFNPPYEGEI